jgi:hypothetical protein
VSGGKKLSRKGEDKDKVQGPEGEKRYSTILS